MSGNPRPPARRPAARGGRRRSDGIEAWLWSESGQATRRWLWTVAVLLCVTGFILRHLETAGILLALPGGWLFVYLLGHHIDQWRAGR